MSTDQLKTESTVPENEKVEDLISPGIRFNLGEISKTIEPISTIWQRQVKPEPVSTTEKDSSSSEYEEDEILEKSSSPQDLNGVEEVVVPKRKRKRKRKRKAKLAEVPVPRERPQKRRKLARIVQPENVHIRFDEDGIPDKIVEVEQPRLKARVIKAFIINLKVYESFSNNKIVEFKEFAPEIVTPIMERPPDLMPRIIKGIKIIN